MSQTVEKQPQILISELLKGSGLNLSVAESCTGGNISHLITIVPGASEYYLGSVTSYAVEIKNKLLSVPFEVVDKYGIVSAQVASCMAEGVRKLTGSVFSVATTGWADAYGDEHEPAGTCWIAVSGPDGTITRRSSSHRSRTANINHFSRITLRTLAIYISNHINNLSNSK